MACIDVEQTNFLLASTNDLYTRTNWQQLDSAMKKLDGNWMQERDILAKADASFQCLTDEDMSGRLLLTATGSNISMEWFLQNCAQPRTGQQIAAQLLLEESIKDNQCEQCCALIRRYTSETSALGEVVHRIGYCTKQVAPDVLYTVLSFYLTRLNITKSTEPLPFARMEQPETTWGGLRPYLDMCMSIKTLSKTLLAMYYPDIHQPLRNTMLKQYRLRSKSYTAQKQGWHKGCNFCANNKEWEPYIQHVPCRWHMNTTTTQEVTYHMDGKLTIARAGKSCKGDIKYIHCRALKCETCFPNCEPIIETVKTAYPAASWAVSRALKDRGIKKIHCNGHAPNIFQDSRLTDVYSSDLYMLLTSEDIDEVASEMHRFNTTGHTKYVTVGHKELINKVCGLVGHELRKVRVGDRNRTVYIWDHYQHHIFPHYGHNDVAPQQVHQHKCIKCGIVFADCHVDMKVSMTKEHSTCKSCTVYKDRAPLSHDHEGLIRGRRVIHKHNCLVCGGQYQHAHTIKHPEDSKLYPHICYRCRPQTQQYCKHKYDNIGPLMLHETVWIQELSRALGFDNCDENIARFNQLDNSTPLTRTRNFVEIFQDILRAIETPRYPDRLMGVLNPTENWTLFQTQPEQYLDILYVDKKDPIKTKWATIHAKRRGATKVRVRFEKYQHTYDIIIRTSDGSSLACELGRDQPKKISGAINNTKVAGLLGFETCPTLTLTNNEFTAMVLTTFVEDEVANTEMIMSMMSRPAAIMTLLFRFTRINPERREQMSSALRNLDLHDMEDLTCAMEKCIDMGTNDFELVQSVAACDYITPDVMKETLGLEFPFDKQPTHRMPTEAQIEDAIFQNGEKELFECAITYGAHQLMHEVYSTMSQTVVYDPCDHDKIGPLPPLLNQDYGTYNSLLALLPNQGVERVPPSLIMCVYGRMLNGSYKPEDNTERTMWDRVHKIISIDKTSFDCFMKYAKNTAMEWVIEKNPGPTWRILTTKRLLTLVYGTRPEISTLCVRLREASNYPGAASTTAFNDSVMDVLAKTDDEMMTLAKQKLIKCMGYIPSSQFIAATMLSLLDSKDIETLLKDEAYMGLKRPYCVLQLLLSEDRIEAIDGVFPRMMRSIPNTVRRMLDCMYDPDCRHEMLHFTKKITGCEKIDQLPNHAHQAAEEIPEIAMDTPGEDPPDIGAIATAIKFGIPTITELTLSERQSDRLQTALRAVKEGKPPEEVVKHISLKVPFPVDYVLYNMVLSSEITQEFCTSLSGLRQVPFTFNTCLAAQRMLREPNNADVNAALAALRHLTSYIDQTGYILSPTEDIQRKMWSLQNMRAVVVSLYAAFIHFDYSIEQARRLTTIASHLAMVVGATGYAELCNAATTSDFALEAVIIMGFAAGYMDIDDPSIKDQTTWLLIWEHLFLPYPPSTKMDMRTSQLMKAAADEAIGDNKTALHLQNNNEDLTTERTVYIIGESEHALTAAPPNARKLRWDTPEKIDEPSVVYIATKSGTHHTVAMEFWKMNKDKDILFVLEKPAFCSLAELREAEASYQFVSTPMTGMNELYQTLLYSRKVTNINLSLTYSSPEECYTSNTLTTIMPYAAYLISESVELGKEEIQAMLESMAVSDKCIRFKCSNVHCLIDTNTDAAPFVTMMRDDTIMTFNKPHFPTTAHVQRVAKDDKFLKVYRALHNKYDAIRGMLAGKYRQSECTALYTMLCTRAQSLSRAAGINHTWMGIEFDSSDEPALDFDMLGDDEPHSTGASNHQLLKLSGDVEENPGPTTKNMAEIFDLIVRIFKVEPSAIPCPYTTDTSQNPTDRVVARYETLERNTASKIDRMPEPEHVSADLCQLATDIRSNSCGECMYCRYADKCYKLAQLMSSRLNSTLPTRDKTYPTVLEAVMSVIAYKGRPQPLKKITTVARVSCLMLYHTMAKRNETKRAFQVRCPTTCAEHTMSQIFRGIAPTPFITPYREELMRTTCSMAEIFFDPPPVDALEDSLVQWVLQSHFQPRVRPRGNEPIIHGKRGLHKTLTALTTPHAIYTTTREHPNPPTDTEQYDMEGIGCIECVAKKYPCGWSRALCAPQRVFSFVYKLDKTKLMRIFFRGQEKKTICQSRIDPRRLLLVPVCLDCNDVGFTRGHDECMVVPIATVITSNPNNDPPSKLIDEARPYAIEQYKKTLDIVRGNIGHERNLRVTKRIAASAGAELPSKQPDKTNAQVSNGSQVQATPASAEGQHQDTLKLLFQELDAADKRQPDREPNAELLSRLPAYFSVRLATADPTDSNEHDHVKDLTTEGIEPNPGPLTNKQIMEFMLWTKEEDDELETFTTTYIQMYGFPTSKKAITDFRTHAIMRFPERLLERSGILEQMCNFRLKTKEEQNKYIAFSAQNGFRGPTPQECRSREFSKIPNATEFLQQRIIYRPRTPLQSEVFEMLLNKGPMIHKDICDNMTTPRQHLRRNVASALRAMCKVGTIHKITSSDPKAVIRYAANTSP